MFVLLQTVEHFNSNLAKNHISRWLAKRKIKNFCPKFLIFLKFCTLEGTVVWSEIIVVDRKNDEELMEMLGLMKTFNKMAKVNGVLWYEHVVRRDDDNVLRKALMLEGNGQRSRGRQKQI